MTAVAPQRGGRLWTLEEDRIIDSYWGEEPEGVTADRVQRTVAAVRVRLRSRGWSASATQGRTAIAGLARKTGHSWWCVKAAVIRLGLRPIRLRRRKDGAKSPSILLDEGQVAAVVELLEAGLPARQTIHAIAQDLGVTHGTVQRRALAIGVVPAPWTALAAEDAARLRAALTLWGELYVACSSCGTSGSTHLSQHWADGLCWRCAQSS